jgi:hypothetical protein
MGLSHSPRIVTNGLVLALDAANPKSYPGSGTTWTDLSGNGNHGTLTNGPTFSNGGINLDRVDDYINIPNSSSLQLIGDMSISIWFNPSNFSVGRQGLVGRNGLNEYTITLEQGGTVSFYFASANQPGSYFNGLSFRTFGQVNSVYQLLTITRNFTSNIGIIYKNGLQTDSASLSGVTPPTATAEPMTIGNGNGGLYIGAIGNVSLYNRSLSATEITQNFTALRGRYGV